MGQAMLAGRNTAPYIPTEHVPYVVATGVVNAYTIELPAHDVYVEGQGFAVKIPVSNTGASTLKLNSLATKSILSASGEEMVADSLKAESVYTVRYNGTNFILQGEGGSGGKLESRFGNGVGQISTYQFITMGYKSVLGGI